MTWIKPITSGTPPGARAGHTCSAVGNKLYIFGGGDGVLYLNDLHILDTEAETMQWSQAYVAGTSPSARSRHSTTCVGTKLFVIGGGDESRVYNDLFVLDTATNTWSRPDTAGDAPSGRWGHSATHYNDKLYVFGGHDGTRMLGDLYILDLGTMTWSACPVPGLPSARAGHTATLFDSKLYIFGGGDGSQILNDLYVLDLEKACACTQLRRSLIQGATPSARFAHTSTLWNRKMLLFGGGDGSRRFKDLYVLDLAGLSDAPKKKAKNRKRRSTSGLKNDLTSWSVERWLKAIGMEAHAAAFKKEDISMEVLPMLTESHLVELGVDTLGARLRILYAISEDPSLGGSKRTSSQGDGESTDITRDLSLPQTVRALNDTVQELSHNVVLLTESFRDHVRNGDCPRGCRVVENGTGVDPPASGNVHGEM